MNFSKYTFLELNKIYFQLGIEYLKRVWWLILIMISVSLLCSIYFHKINKKVK